MSEKRKAEDDPRENWWPENLSDEDDTVTPKEGGPSLGLLTIERSEQTLSRSSSSDLDLDFMADADAEMWADKLQEYFLNREPGPEKKPKQLPVAQQNPDFMRQDHEIALHQKNLAIANQIVKNYGAKKQKTKH